MRASAASVLAALFPVLLHAAPIFATTWVVDPRGGGHAPTISGGLALASSGDSVLVVPGTYSEHGLLLRGGVTLLSQGGPQVTTIDGSDAGPILWCQPALEASVIEGFTLTQARGDSIGGAIVCLAMSRPRIIGNIIVGNTSAHGGAIGCAGYSSPVIEGNVITDNIASAEGGGVFGLHYCDVTVASNVFRRNRALAASGGAMWFGDRASVTVSGNTIADNLAPGGAGGGIWLGESLGSFILIEGNLFARDSCGLAGGAIYVGRVNVIVRRGETRKAITSVPSTRVRETFSRRRVCRVSVPAQRWRMASYCRCTRSHHRHNSTLC